MNIMFIGDIVGDIGVTFIENNLYNIKKNNKIDFVIANGENSAVGNGILPQSAQRLFASGINVITGGNHTFSRWEIKEFLNENDNIIRPINYPECKFGKGYTIKKIQYQGKEISIAVINLIGTVFIDNYDNPFIAAEKIVNQLRKKADIIFIDFHAETTSEKTALGFFLDGKADVIAGTHTHVATADERILPKGTAYITDVGMVGPSLSVLGVAAERIIEKFITKMPVKFIPGNGPTIFSSVIIEFDDRSLKPVSIERYSIEK